MHREIKFRAKSKETNKFIYGDYQSNPYASISFINSDNELDCFEVIKETLGQFTGFKDKCGKKVFEGDLVVFENNTIQHEVRFHNGSFCLFVDGKCYVYSINNKVIEVVGNLVTRKNNIMKAKEVREKMFELYPDLQKELGDIFIQISNAMLNKKFGVDISIDTSSIVLSHLYYDLGYQNYPLDNGFIHIYW